MPEVPCQPPDFGLPQGPIPEPVPPAEEPVAELASPPVAGLALPSEIEEDRDTRRVWSVLGVSTQNYIIAVYLSPRFITLKDLCDFHHLCYHSVYQALSRRGLIEQRAGSEHQYKRTIEQSTRGAINELISRIRSGMSTLDIIDTKIRSAILTERIPLKTLKELHSRISADVVKETMVLNGLIAAQESQMVPEISQMEVTQQTDTVAGASSSSSPLGEASHQKFAAQMRRMAVKFTFKDPEEAGSDGNGQHSS